MSIAAPDDSEVTADAQTDTRGRVPIISIPERDLPVWQDPELATDIREAISDAEAARTVDLGDFDRYLGEASDGDLVQ